MVTVFFSFSLFFFFSFAFILANPNRLSLFQINLTKSRQVWITLLFSSFFPALRDFSANYNAMMLSSSLSVLEPVAAESSLPDATTDLVYFHSAACSPGVKLGKMPGQLQGGGQNL